MLYATAEPQPADRPVAAEFLMRSCKTLKGGLQDVADELQVARIGPQHQAGSDSLLTASTFFKMRSKYFDDEIDDKYLGVLYGLGSFASFGGGPVTSSLISGYSGAVTPSMPNALTPGVGQLPLPAAASAAVPIKDPFGNPYKGH